MFDFRPTFTLAIVNKLMLNLRRNKEKTTMHTRDNRQILYASNKLRVLNKLAVIIALMRQENIVAYFARVSH